LRYVPQASSPRSDFAAKPMWAEWYPENAISWVLEDIATHTEAYEVDDKEGLEAQLAMCEYWKNRTMEYAFLTHLSDSEICQVRT